MRYILKGCRATNEYRMGGSMKTLLKHLIQLRSYCKQKWQYWGKKLGILSQQDIKEEPLPNSWPALDVTLKPFAEQKNVEKLEQPLTTSAESSRPNTQWVLAETTDADNKNNVVLVEVEFFPNDTHVGDLRGPQVRGNMTSYTIDGEDPNLRITHFPPSNCLH